jgi:chromosome segregation ATPase
LIYHQKKNSNIQKEAKPVVQGIFQNEEITKIKLTHFMTFNDITIVPSSGLNLIIGPNGSGKSSIVCAIGLGLGAQPTLLARTGKISGYVKRRQKS